jgi:hypothetical protein
MSGQKTLPPVNGFIVGKYPLIRAVMTKGALTGESERPTLALQPGITGKNIK